MKMPNWLYWFLFNQSRPTKKTESVFRYNGTFLEESFSLSSSPNNMSYTVNTFTPDRSIRWSVYP